MIHHKIIYSSNDYFFKIKKKDHAFKRSTKLQKSVVTFHQEKCPSILALLVSLWAIKFELLGRNVRSHFEEQKKHHYINFDTVMVSFCICLKFR